MDNFCYNKEEDMFYIYHTFSNNQIGFMGFQMGHPDDNTKNYLEINTVLAIADKKKYIRQWIKGQENPLELVSTGKCGLEGLLWAKKTLFLFEERIQNYAKRYSYDRINIYFSGANKKRFQVYYKALHKYGYRKVNYKNTWYGMKTIIIKEEK